MFECRNLLDKSNIYYNEPLSKHTSVGIGGPAKVFVTPTTFYDLLQVVKFAEDSAQKYKIIGGGSNILFADEGFNGIIISTRNISMCSELEDDRVIVSCGMMAAELLKRLRDLNLSGFEWAVGIPATIGGMIYQNAGAYNSSMSDIIRVVTFFEDGKIKSLNRDELCFSYRDSYFKNHNAIIMSVELKLKREKRKVIEEKISEYLKLRNESQPKGRSLGSIFKNENYSSGKIIDEAKLKGLNVGDAVVSYKHANFIVNTGNATSNDYKKLIDIIKAKVKETTGIILKEEIEIIGK